MVELLFSNLLGREARADSHFHDPLILGIERYSLNSFFVLCDCPALTLCPFSFLLWGSKLVFLPQSIQRKFLQRVPRHFGEHLRKGCVSGNHEKFDVNLLVSGFATFVSGDQVLLTKICEPYVQDEKHNATTSA